MGILNVTPDSFYADSRRQGVAEIESRVRQMMDEGVDMIDIGGYSTRPGATEVFTAEEIERLREGMTVIRKVAPEIPVSVDTFRSEVARAAVEEMGADIVNDISAGQLDHAMIPTVAQLGVPYIMMHMRGTPSTMQQMTQYEGDDVTAAVIGELTRPLAEARQAGICDIVLDPGFGFAKTLDQNYSLLAHLRDFIEIMKLPTLVGVSRKSMLTKLLNINPEQALNATTAVNMIALQAGASILRVHDVVACRQAVDIWMATISNS